MKLIVAKTAGFCMGVQRAVELALAASAKYTNPIYTFGHQGCTTIIWGEADHPEVIGLLGCAREKGFVVDTFDTLKTLPSFKNAIIVAQTTQNIRTYTEVENWVNQQYPHYKIFNTICDSTAKRQAEVKQISMEVDVVIVVGGHDSGNTKRLAEIVKENGKSAYHVETAKELNSEILKDAQSIGISAGASTPHWIIDKIYETLKHEL